jgi:hypothetical protein
MANFAQQMGALTADSKGRMHEESKTKLARRTDKILKRLKDEIKKVAATGQKKIKWQTGPVLIQDLIVPEVRAKIICESALMRFDSHLREMGFQKFQTTYTVDRIDVQDKPPQQFYAIFEFQVCWETPQEQQAHQDMKKQMRQNARLEIDRQNDERKMRLARANPSETHPTEFRGFQKLTEHINEWCASHTIYMEPRGLKMSWSPQEVLMQMFVYVDTGCPHVFGTSLEPPSKAKNDDEAGIYIGCWHHGDDRDCEGRYWWKEISHGRVTRLCDEDEKKAVEFALRWIKLGVERAPPPRRRPHVVK